MGDIDKTTQPWAMVEDTISVSILNGTPLAKGDNDGCHSKIEKAIKMWVDGGNIMAQGEIDVVILQDDDHALETVSLVRYIYSVLKFV